MWYRRSDQGLDLEAQMTSTNDSPVTRKARGAFFTPPEIADFLSEWAIRESSDRVLEPSCGEAAFLTAAVKRLKELGVEEFDADQLHGVDIHEESVASAQEELESLRVRGTLHAGDFFDLGIRKAFDAVVGNPPYVRYQNFSGRARAKAAEAALAQGVRLTGLASSWAAFVVHASAFLKPSGRLALVLPAELLTVSYAAPVRSFLMRRFSQVRLIVFAERVFPGVLEEVVLLLAEGEGPTDHCELFQAQDLEALGELDKRTWTPSEVEGKWTAAFLHPEAAKIYGRLTSSAAFCQLEEWGETTLGMVSGSNRYFALNAERVRELGLGDGDLLRISPPGSRHLRGLTFTDKSWRDMRDRGARVYLFDPPAGDPSSAACSYIEAGKKRGVDKAYKCSVRSPWWKVPRVTVPDLFLTYMNHDAPRLVANRAGLAYLNSIHGVCLKEGSRQIGMDLLPIGALNSLTLLGAELVGRAYGGGMLKMEPREADVWPVPTRATLEGAQRALRSLRPQLARYLRNGDLGEVVKLVDKALLRRYLGVTRKELDELRAAREQLFDRRQARAGSKK